MNSAKTDNFEILEEWTLRGDFRYFLVKSGLGHVNVIFNGVDSMRIDTTAQKKTANEYRAEYMSDYITYGPTAVKLSPQVKLLNGKWSTHTGPYVGSDGNEAGYDTFNAKKAAKFGTGDYVTPKQREALREWCYRLAEFMRQQKPEEFVAAGIAALEREISSATGRVSDILTKQLEPANQRVVAAQQALAEYKKQHSLLP